MDDRIILFFMSLAGLLQGVINKYIDYLVLMLWFLIYSFMWCNIWSFCFLFIRSSGFGLRAQLERILSDTHVTFLTKVFLTSWQQSIVFNKNISLRLKCGFLLSCQMTLVFTIKLIMGNITLSFQSIMFFFNSIVSQFNFSKLCLFEKAS